MKAGKSSAIAIVLPSLATYCLVVSKVTSSVAIPRMSSTSSISGTGFMKWMPMKRSGRSVAEASRVIEIDDVLVPMIASGLSTGQTLANMNGRVAGTGLRPLFDLNHALSPALPSACGQSRLALFLTSNFAEFRRQFRKRLVQIGDEPNVGHLEDGRLFVLVDGHNDLRILHTGEMLDRAGNPDCDVKLRCHDLAGLADLPVVGGIAGINRGPRGADGGPKFIGDRLDIFGEVFPTLHGAPPRNDDLSRGELGALRFG